MRRFIMLLIILFLWTTFVYAKDFKVTVIREATETHPRIIEVIEIVNAIDENGKAIRIQSHSQQISIQQLDQMIANGEMQVAKLKAIKAEAEKIAPQE